MITLKQLNKILANKAIKAEVIKNDGDDYFYLIGEDVKWSESTSIYVAKLNHMSIENWIEDMLKIVAETTRYNEYLNSLK
jgi:hypothetical protein